jgi:nucleotide-binding universal stress UspA family protein
MFKMVVAVDGSENSLHAVGHAAKRAAPAQADCQIHLVNVQHPVHGGVSTFVSAAQIKDYHRDEGMKALAPGRALLDEAKIPYEHHLFVGDPAEVVARFASEQGCDEIIIGTRGLSGISSLLLGSVASKIIHHATVPVVLVK